MLKMIKKVSKMHTPPKTPKCQINGQNRHFVKSEPPGPAFFRFQGVPRDPVLRPKSTPSFLNVKSDAFFIMCTFCELLFCEFWCFINCANWHFWCEVTFFTIRRLRVIRPYSDYIVGGRMLVWWFSPHLLMMCFSLVDVYFLTCRGEYTGRSFNTLVLPLWTGVTCRGDSQGSQRIILSFSPLWTGFLFFVYFWLVKLSGRFTGRSYF